LLGRKQGVPDSPDVPRQRDARGVLALAEAEPVLLDSTLFQLATEAAVPGSAVDADDLGW
jgi:hypothetical protein